MHSTSLRLTLATLCALAFSTFSASAQLPAASPDRTLPPLSSFGHMAAPAASQGNPVTTSQAAPVAGLPARSKPPIILIKLDDLSQVNNAIPSNFKKMADYVLAHHIKAGFGVICAVTWPGAQPLSASGPEYIDWVKKLNATGQIEFWLHGWDHTGHDVDGLPHCEFNGRTFEDQKDRFDRAQAVAMEKFGFHFTAFGPGGTPSKFPSFDENTLKVLAADPYMKAMYYPMGIDAAGKQLDAQGKVTIINRVGDVNLEKSVGNPDFNWFLQGYKKHPDVDYFALQGHPNTWNDVKIAEVYKIIDFLISQNAVFMTPTEFANSRKSH